MKSIRLYNSKGEFFLEQPLHSINLTTEYIRQQSMIRFHTPTPCSKQESIIQNIYSYMLDEFLDGLNTVIGEEVAWTKIPLRLRSAIYLNEPVDFFIIRIV